MQILVGPDEVRFHAPRSVLCDASPYFRAALSGQFLEARTRTIILDEDEPAMFKHFLHWLCFQVVKMSDKDNNQEWTVISHLYVFGLVRQIPKLQNVAIDELIAKEKRIQAIPIGELNYIYENTGETDQLRNLDVDISAHK